MTGAILPIQFIIRNQLSEQENLWLKGLTDKLKADGTAELLIEDYVQNQNNPLYETALQMIMNANKDFFDKEGNVKMIQALKELCEKQLRREWQAEWNAAMEENIKNSHTEGLSEGRIQGMIELCKDMELSLEDTISRITTKFKDDSIELQNQIINFWNTLPTK